MDTQGLESQKHRDVIAAFWPRKLSRHITSLLLKTPITANQTTVLWGAISAMNSYVVYRVIVGDLLLLPVIPLVYVLTYVLDCVDGEIARGRKKANPVGGKLLDGVCHRTTEYSLLTAYVCGAARLVDSPWVLPIGLLLISGEAMYTYAYERRLTTLRVNIGFTGLVSSTAGNMYERGEGWRDLSWRRRIGTFKGQIHYKSIYAVILVAYISGIALAGGLALLGLYKHVSWIRLIVRTLTASEQQVQGAAAKPVEAATTASPAAEAL